MVNNRDAEYLSNYVVEHYIEIPSKITDYDYDLNRPDRRFISTIRHHLKFYDKVTLSEIVSIMFPYEVGSDIITSFSQITGFGWGMKEYMFTTLRGAYLDNYIGKCLITMVSDKPYVILQIIAGNNHYCLRLTEEDLDIIIALLEDDDADMFDEGIVL